MSADLHLTRRSFLGATGLVGLGAVGLGGCGDNEAQRLVFYNWQDYIDTKLLKDFGADAGIETVYETYASNDELSARLGQAGATRRRGRKGTTFDLIVPSDNLLTDLRDADALLELGSLAGLDHLASEFRRTSFDPGNRFSVPWATGTTGIGYSMAAFPDGPPDWSAFLDPAVSGKATVLDETRDAMAMALFLLGEDPNTTDASTIAAAGKKLKEVVANGVEFDASTYLKRLRSGSTVLAEAFSSDVLQAMSDNDDLAFVVPDNGGLRWIDSLCIPAEAPHPDIAKKFIEFYLRPEVSAANSVAVRVDTGNEAAREFVPQTVLDDPAIFPPESIVDRLSFTEALDAEVEDRYSKAFATAKGS